MSADFANLAGRYIGSFVVCAVGPLAASVFAKKTNGFRPAVVAGTLAGASTIFISTFNVGAA